MMTSDQDRAVNAAARRWNLIGSIACLLLFAFLMGVRDEFSNLWIRVGLAALAGPCFALAVCLLARYRKSKT